MKSQNSNHTQGTWSLNQWNELVSENGKAIKVAGSVTLTSNKGVEETANMNLIAAAPELLKELQNMVQAFEEYAELAQYKSGIYMAKIAILKASI